MGPFELMDLIGHDVNYAVTCSVFDAYYQDPRFTPSIIQKELLNAGFLGRKSGRGFYPYGEGAQPPSPQQLPACTESSEPVLNASSVIGSIIAARLGAAGIAFGDAVMDFLQLVRHVREAEILTANRCFHVSAAELRKLIQHGLEARILDCIQGIG